MAEVVVSPIVDFILPLIGTDSRLPNDLNKDLKKLSNTFSIIRLVLDDAEKKQIKHKSIRGWLRMLKDAAYEAEDIMDDCALEFQRIESEVGEPSCGKQSYIEDARTGTGFPTFGSRILLNCETINANV